jgi:coatomer subunit beta
MLETLQQIRTVIGEVPILASEQRLLDAAEAEAEAEAQADESGNSKPVQTTTTKVLADGTYATETSFSVTASASLNKVKAQTKPPLRALLLGGDFYTGSVLASALTKLVLRFVGLSQNSSLINELRAEAMLMMTSVIRVGQSQFVSVPIDEDSVERITTCLQALAEVTKSKPIEDIFLHDTQAAYTQMIAHVEKKAAEKRGKDKKSVAVQPDDLINFRQFAKKNDGYIDDYEADLTQATGNLDTANDFLSKLSRIVQLTGFSDPVYAEAYVNVNQFDIMLDVLIVNQTPETLQNLTVEFATLGDLKLVERPIPHTLGPMSFQSIKATIKVSSTETGVIFGNIFYDGPATSDGHCVVLNDIHIDILDYIKPAFCNENQFRSMWTEFEWENKVNVNTAIDDLRTCKLNSPLHVCSEVWYVQALEISMQTELISPSSFKPDLDHIMAATNMSCLTPDAALSGDCGFLSANMYARSLFGKSSLSLTESFLFSGSIDSLLIKFNFDALHFFFFF